jgi:hypothetical protein
MTRSIASGARPLAIFALVVTTGLGLSTLAAGLLVTPAYAQDHGDEGGHAGGQRGGKSGGSGGHDDGGHEDEGEDGGHEDGGHEDGGHESGGHDSGGKGQGAKGQGGSGAQGGSGGQGGNSGDRGGAQGGQSQSRPVWAQEGIPEVELGRLNVARAPDRVIDRAYSEALGSLTPEVASFYAQSLEQMEDSLRTDWDNVQFIDSPLQNLALMRDALDGSSVLVTSGISGDNDALLAVFLGTASDKSVPITADTALAVSTILGQPLSRDEAAALAEDAERIRQAIVQGHG